MNLGTELEANLLVVIFSPIEVGAFLVQVDVNNNTIQKRIESFERRILAFTNIESF